MALRELLGGEKERRTSPREMRPLVAVWWDGLRPD
jgi:hypothetical protein